MNKWKMALPLVIIECKSSRPTNLNTEKSFPDRTETSVDKKETFMPNNTLGSTDYVITLTLSF
jgi:hypothetical protein